jgi:hypothetical protein
MRGSVRNSEVEVDSDILGGTRQATGVATTRVAENGEEMNDWERIKSESDNKEERTREASRQRRERDEPSLANATGGTEPNIEDWQTES